MFQPYIPGEQKFSETESTLLYQAGREGKLMALLKELPRERWGQFNSRKWSLLHFAALGPNEEALKTLIIQGGLGLIKRIDQADDYGRCVYMASHIAAACNQPRMLELLIAAGTSFPATSPLYHSILYGVVVRNAKNGDACVRIMIANGLRLLKMTKTTSWAMGVMSLWKRLAMNGEYLSHTELLEKGDSIGRYVTPELLEFERGVLRCRQAVLAMLRVKRAGKLARWDKFLLHEMAVCIWSTRYDAKWMRGQDSSGLADRRKKSKKFNDVLDESE